MMKGNEKIRIGIACNYFGFSGGMERYTIDIASEFVQRGYEVIIYAKKADPEIPKKIGVILHLCSCSFVPGKLQPLFFSKWIKKYKNECDVLIGCCRTDAADIYICGGTHIGFLKHTNKKQKWYDRLFIDMEHKAYSNARIIVAHSISMQQELKELYGIDGHKIVTAFPPVDGEAFAKPTNEEHKVLCSKFGLDNNKKHFLFVSSSHERKGFPLLREYFSKTDLPIDLIVVGRPISAESEHIRYLGYRKDIQNLYKAADFTIMASTYEPFGLVAIESVLCGTPVVLANHIGCCAAISNKAKTTFIEGDMKSLDEAIKTALKGPSRSCGATDVLSPTSIAKHVDIIERLVKNSNPILAIKSGDGTC